ncbi:hypothetical protein WAK64_19620 [Bacillus spongiae]|uniref:Uncharacterized protein n=1 Tax=Bacillus spongiae TaxID=2683610 RepID=A0ABU8HIM9_9BACI
MLEDLDAAISKLSYETDVDLHLVGFKVNLDTLTIDINLTYYDDNEIQEQWQIVCDDFRTHTLKYEVFVECKVFNEHELLWNYNKEWCEVFFDGRPDSTKEVMGELLKTHFDNTKGNIPFGKYINGRVDKLLEGEFGLFATGPINLMDSYRNVLTMYGFKTTVLPLHYRNSREYSTDYKLLEMGDSYIVAKGFSANKIERKY